MQTGCPKCATMVRSKNGTEWEILEASCVELLGTGWANKPEFVASRRARRYLAGDAWRSDGLEAGGFDQSSLRNFLLRNCMTTNATPTLAAIPAQVRISSRDRPNSKWAMYANVTEVNAALATYNRIDKDLSITFSIIGTGPAFACVQRACLPRVADRSLTDCRQPQRKSRPSDRAAWSFRRRLVVLCFGIVILPACCSTSRRNMPLAVCGFRRTGPDYPGLPCRARSAVTS